MSRSRKGLNTIACQSSTTYDNKIVYRFVNIKNISQCRLIICRSLNSIINWVYMHINDDDNNMFSESYPTNLIAACRFNQIKAIINEQYEDCIKIENIIRRLLTPEQMQEYAYIFNE